MSIFHLINKIRKELLEMYGLGMLRLLNRHGEGFSAPLEGLGKIKFPVYVFGYGSLLFPYGWNRRGMQKIYEDDDLIPCWLNGYKRGMYGRFHRQLYYGIIPQDGARCNGIIARVDNEYDYVKLMDSERAEQVIRAYYPYDVGPINYRIADVTSMITDAGPNREEGLRIHAVVNRVEDPLREKAMPVWAYYAHVWKEINQYRSKKFVKDFLATGGIDVKTLKEMFLVQPALPKETTKRKRSKA
jgi:hypothetical protein